MATGSSPVRGKILVLPGDHVGPEIMAEALKVLDILKECRNINFDISHDIAGGCSIDKYGVPVTAAVLEKAKQSDAVLFGSVGGPEW
jgi:3-isopropylmalate dehydrogenase